MVEECEEMLEIQTEFNSSEGISEWTPTIITHRTLYYCNTN